MIVESLLIIGFALLLDFKLGDPKNKYHPTAWIGLALFLQNLHRSQKMKTPQWKNLEVFVLS